jgi:hypothetical protein
MTLNLENLTMSNFGASYQEIPYAAQSHGGNYCLPPVVSIQQAMHYTADAV